MDTQFEDGKKLVDYLLKNWGNKREFNGAIKTGMSCMCVHT